MKSAITETEKSRSTRRHSLENKTRKETEEDSLSPEIVTDSDSFGRLVGRQISPRSKSLAELMRGKQDNKKGTSRAITRERSLSPGNMINDTINIYGIDSDGNYSKEGPLPREVVKPIKRSKGERQGNKVNAFGSITQVRSQTLGSKPFSKWKKRERGVYHKDSLSEGSLRSPERKPITQRIMRTSQDSVKNDIGTREKSQSSASRSSTESKKAGLATSSTTDHRSRIGRTSAERKMIGMDTSRTIGTHSKSTSRATRRSRKLKENKANTDFRSALESISPQNIYQTIKDNHSGSSLGRTSSERMKTILESINMSSLTGMSPDTPAVRPSLQRMKTPKTATNAPGILDKVTKSKKKQEKDTSKH